MPVFTAKHNELKLQEQGQSLDQLGKIDMLGTIKLPKNMKLISGNLPESNYESDKEKKQKKQKRKDIDSSHIIRPDSMLDEIAEDKEAEDQEIGGIQSSNRRQYRQPRIKNDIFSSRDRKDKGELNINIQGGNLQPAI